MKKNNRLSKGMTLVEVIIAMTIFAMMAAAIFGVILHATKQSNKSKMRDVELAGETNTIARKVNAKLNQVKPGDYAGDYKIIFNDGTADKDGNSPTVDNAKVYETDEGPFNEEFDFKMKTVVKASALTGLTVDSLNENEYSFTVKNELKVPLTFRVELTKGFIFEGTGRQYIHTSQTYTKTIPAQSEVNLGYYCDGYSSDNLTFYYMTSLSAEYTGNFDTTRFDPDDETKRIAKVIVTGAEGTDPTIHGTIKYNNET